MTRTILTGLTGVAVLAVLANIPADARQLRFSGGFNAPTGPHGNRGASRSRQTPFVGGINSRWGQAQRRGKSELMILITPYVVRH
jgi:hypothetical protein